MAKTIFTKAKEILIAPWTESEGALVAPTTAGVIELTSVIADSLTITQEDPETTDIDCETSDEPIYSVTKAGKYTVELNNASIDDEYLEKVMGWEKDGNNFVAPCPTLLAISPSKLASLRTPSICISPRCLSRPSWCSNRSPQILLTAR